MRFLWKSQLPTERGKLLPKKSPERSRMTRKERLAIRAKKTTRSSFLVIFLWLLFCGTLVYLVLFSSYLALAPWHVSGLSLVNEDDFRQTVDEQLAHKYFGIFDRSRYFLVRPEALANTLKERYPLLRAVTVRRTFPDGLEIVVAERESIVSWCVAENCAQVLEDGDVIPTTAVYQKEENQARTLTLRDESNQPLRYGAGVFSSDFVPFILTLRRSLQNDFGLVPESEMFFASRFAEELRLKTDAGYEVYFSTRFLLQSSLSALHLLFDEEIPVAQRSQLRYIDLRTENRIFYLYQDGAGQPQEVSVPSKPVSEVKLSGEKKKK